MFFVVTYMSALFQAYAEYLERMLQDTAELTPIDIDSMPHDVDWDRVSEWADIG